MKSTDGKDIDKNKLAQQFCGVAVKALTASNSYITSSGNYGHVAAAQLNAAAAAMQTALLLEQSAKEDAGPARPATFGAN